MLAELTVKSDTCEKQLKTQEPALEFFDKFDNYVTATNQKSSFVKSGALATSVFETLEDVPRPLHTNMEIDGDEFYWTEMLESNNMFKPNAPDQSQASGTFTISQLLEMFPPAPELRKFYTIEEAVELSDKIVATGLPNYQGARVEIKSGLNIPAWKFFLQGYDKEKVVLDGITYGWLLNWTCNPPLCGQTIPNHPTAEKKYPVLFKEWTKSQTDLGMLIGPLRRDQLPWPNLTTVPLHTVDKDVKLGTRRICADPSYTPPGWPAGWSLNSGIQKDFYANQPFSYQLPRIADFVNDAKKIGLEKVLGFKIDWKFAFRQNPLDPCDWWLTVYFIDGQGYFMDIRTNFGYRASGIPQQLEAESVPFMLSKVKLSQSGSWFVRPFFDDEIGIADPIIAKELFEASLDLHKILGIRLSTSNDHVIAPTRVLLALGTVLDFDLACVYMPDNKLEKLLMVIQTCKEKEVWTRQDLQRLLGLLNHWVEVVRAGKVFLNRMLPAYKQLSPTRSHFSPTPEFRLDLRWWERVAPNLNYQAMMILKSVTPEQSVDMDASTSWGLGAVNFERKEFFLLPNPPFLKGLPIHCGEMGVLVLSVDLRSGPLSNSPPDLATGFYAHHLSWRSDNSAVISVINRGKAKDDFLAKGLRYVTAELAIRDATLTLSYVNTKENSIADPLSRGCVETCSQLISSGYTQLFVPESRLEALMALQL